MKRFSCGGDNNTTQQDHNILLDIKDHTYTKKQNLNLLKIISMEKSNHHVNGDQLLDPLSHLQVSHM